jgi:hypothetical protein
VPFKATAGLHHPVRALRPLTTELKGPSAVMHGFLNVFLAAAFVSCCGMAFDDAVGILGEEAPARFVVTEDAIAWGSFRVDVEALRAVRRTFATAFGSCSFEEPIEDLQAIGLLES